MDAAKGYLLLYNAAQSAGWALALFQTLRASVQDRRLDTVYAAAGLTVRECRAPLLPARPWGTATCGSLDTIFLEGLPAPQPAYTVANTATWRAQVSARARRSWRSCTQQLVRRCRQRRNASATHVSASGKHTIIELCTQRRPRQLSNSCPLANCSCAPAGRSRARIPGGGDHAVGRPQQLPVRRPALHPRGELLHMHAAL